MNDYALDALMTQNFRCHVTMRGKGWRPALISRKYLVRYATEQGQSHAVQSQSLVEHGRLEVVKYPLGRPLVTLHALLTIAHWVLR